MRKSTCRRWASRLVVVAIALMSFGLAVGSLMTAQDFNWT
jgi:predicted branched-subunit amino acid permease